MRTSIRPAGLVVGLIALFGAAALVPGAAVGSMLGTVGSATPSCPRNCLVEARVTGFQATAGDERKIFRAPAKGRIESWSIDLGMPKHDQIKGFNRKFGDSRARLAILKRVHDKRSRSPRYILLRESRTEPLRAWFGNTASFPLDRPLKVGPGQIVALTIPTWAPAFAVDNAGSSRWLASRRETSRRGGCVTAGGFANIAAGSAHQRRGSRRTYGCAYRGARLLYSVSFVKAAGG